MALKIVKADRFTEIPKLYTKKEVIELLKISTPTLWRLEKKKELLPVRVGGKIMYAERDILEYLNKINKD